MPDHWRGQPDGLSLPAGKIGQRFTHVMLSNTPYPNLGKMIKPNAVVISPAYFRVFSFSDHKGMVISR